jgi:cobalt-precorrin-5B (C1)-methyltransferase
MSRLREGFTTGTCAAAAAKAAVLLLTGNGRPRSVDVRLPGGELATLPVLSAKKKKTAAEAAVRKDAGDDPDITDGCTVLASVSWTGADGVVIEAGEGVGIVTKPGLSVLPGEAAVNPVPRRMIQEALRSVTDRGVRVTISIPGGEALAARTFNPRLGISGGLSILGTSGRVRPFSCPALRASLSCLLDVAVSSGVACPVFVPGRIGQRAARRHFRLGPEHVVEVGNEWGFMLDSVRVHAFDALLVLGHPGKLAKLAMGEWNTHSSRSASAVPWVSGLAAKTLGRRQAESLTVEGVFSSLDVKERRKVGDIVAKKIRRAVRERIGGGVKTSVVLVDMKGEVIGSSGDLKRWRS